MGRYVLGEPVELSAEFRDDAGVLTNPTTVVFYVQAPPTTLLPNGPIEVYDSSTIPAVTNPSVGRYELVLSRTELPVAGVYRYRAEGDSPATGVSEGDFAVRTQLVGI